MAHMRDKTVYCGACNGTCYYTANLDTGKVERVGMPKQCLWPRLCPEKHIQGIWDRRFGERIIRPSDF